VHLTKDDCEEIDIVLDLDRKRSWPVRDQRHWVQMQQEWHSLASTTLLSGPRWNLCTRCLWVYLVGFWQVPRITSWNWHTCQALISKSSQAGMLDLDSHGGSNILSTGCSTGCKLSRLFLHTREGLLANCAMFSSCCNIIHHTFPQEFISTKAANCSTCSVTGSVVCSGLLHAAQQLLVKKEETLSGGVQQTFVAGGTGWQMVLCIPTGQLNLIRPAGAAAWGRSDCHPKWPKPGN
jgi:hypothetical protein